MATVNSTEDTEMNDCDGENVVTMMDVLQEQQEFEEDANAVLGASDDKECTYSKGYIKRQALYVCLTCCNGADQDSTKQAGVCLACSLDCHENHEMVELYTKRNFRCDCGNPKFNNHPCQYTPDKPDLNEENTYNQNFSGLYCVCHRPYPDPEAPVEEEMIQCIICEDWLHSTHLDAIVPSNDLYSEMICKVCMEKNEFLHDYSKYAVNVDENVDVDITDVSIDKSALENETDNSIVNTKAEKETDLSIAESKVEKEPNTSIDKALDENSDETTNENSDETTNENSDETTNENNDETDTNLENADKENETESKNNETETKDDNNTSQTAEQSIETEKNDEQVNATEDITDEKEKDVDGSVESKHDDSKDINMDTTETEKEAPTLPNETIKSDAINEDMAKQTEPHVEESSKPCIEKTENTDTSIPPQESQKETDDDHKEIDAIDQLLGEDNNESKDDKPENQESDKAEEKIELAKEEQPLAENLTETIEPQLESQKVDSVEKTENESTSEPDNTAVKTNGEITDTEINDKKETADVDEIKTNGDVLTTQENKRKLSTDEDEVAPEDNISKKPKLDESSCKRPKSSKIFKGATFWPSDFRQKLCTCNECLTMYKDLSVLFLIDPEDTVSAYESLGKERTNGLPTTQYEKGLQALSSLDRVQQINALTEYNIMKDKLLDFLKSFKDRKEIVKEEDIKAFFSGMKPKREADGVYFCR